MHQSAYSFTRSTFSFWLPVRAVCSDCSWRSRSGSRPPEVSLPPVGPGLRDLSAVEAGPSITVEKAGSVAAGFTGSESPALARELAPSAPAGEPALRPAVSSWTISPCGRFPGSSHQGFSPSERRLTTWKQPLQTRHIPATRAADTGRARRGAGRQPPVFPDSEATFERFVAMDGLQCQRRGWMSSSADGNAAVQLPPIRQPPGVWAGRPVPASPGRTTRRRAALAAGLPGPIQGAGEIGLENISSDLPDLIRAG